jgi:predicted nucleic acid-binding protein
MNSLPVDLIVKEVLNVLWKDYSLRRIIDRETVTELYKIMKSLVNVNIIL